jgi:predicted transcriptional regulator
VFDQDIFCSIQFLSTSVNSALDEKNQDTSPVSFNLGALEGLGIVESKPVSSSTQSTSTQ